MNTITNRVDQIFQEWDKPDSPGCALAVIKEGEIIYKRGYGMANLEHNVPIKPETIFDIGSTSKQFTALCILLLARQGRLSLDDPIQKHIPEMPDYEHPITVRHLIHHTSGIRDYLVLMILANMPMENDYQEHEVVSLIANQKALNFTPGDEFLYCNSGYFLMAEIVERVSGKNMRAFADEHIFAPLGMKNTHFHNNFKEIVPNRASGYAPLENGGFEIDMGIFDVIGDGALYTSVQDLYLWDQNYYDNKLDCGGQELILQMEDVGVLNNGEKLDYGFGLMISKYRGLPVVEHGGAWYGYRAQLMRFPEQRFSVICLANLGTMNPESLCISLADIYLEDTFPEKAKTKSVETDLQTVSLEKEQLAQKVGMFQEKERGSFAEIAVVDGKLTIETMGHSFQLEPLSIDIFKTVQAPISIDIRFEQNNTKITADIYDGMQTLFFTRVEPVRLTSEELDEYTGSFLSKELGTTYTISVVEGQLKISPENRYIKELKPTVKDVFDAGIARLRFLRGEEGSIASFSINAGRVKDIHFAKQN